MNDIIPPSDPNPPSLPPGPETIPAKSAPPSRMLCAGGGVLLFVVSAGLAFVSPVFILVGIAAAIATLFVREYRWVFLGYIISVGLLLLGTIIYCSTHPFRID